MDFIRPFSKDTLLYRSVKLDKYLHGNWYSFTPEITFGYGHITGEFKPVNDLRLIDISREDFYDDFINYINQYNFHPDHKIDLIFPLGFRNFDFYKKCAEKIDLHPQPVSDFVELESQTFGNRSRCSIHHNDTKLFEFLKLNFEAHGDGFFATKYLPNKITNGMHQTCKLRHTSEHPVR